MAANWYTPYAAHSKPDKSEPCHMSGSPKTYPNKAIVILETPGPDGTPDFRIGTLTKKDFEEGLRCSNGVSLNRPVAERCFKGVVYSDPKVAEQIALQQQENSKTEIDGGIKFIQCLEPFPGVECQILTIHTYNHRVNN